MTHRTTQATTAASGYASPPFAVSVTRAGPSTWFVEVQGELDIATGPILREHLEAHKTPSEANGHPLNVIYTLPELEFMDSTGLHTLLTAVDGLAPETITIREPSRQVRRLLELVGLDSMIEEPRHS
ncbi:MAG: STAS domain-containing protein [Acidimicrobiia bacterium]